MLKTVEDLTSQDFSKGLNTISDIFKLEPTQTPNCMDVVFKFDGSMAKRLGSNTMNATALSSTAGTVGVTTAGWAMFDFGAGSNRWLTVAVGTALYASSDLGVNFVRIASDRASTYQYLTRSKNILVACTDAYDNVLQWAGSGGTMASLLNVSAPLAKYAINFQSFLILLNSSTRKRGFFYEDQTTQLTGSFSTNFDLESSADDEITNAFILGTRFFVSTRYRIFKVSYVGGNPDWDVRPVKEWGFVPRTVDKLFIKGIGEVAVGESWDRRLRLFDGEEERIISDNFEHYNGMCDFAMRQVSFSGSGLTTNFGVTDQNEQVYKFITAIGTNSTETTHMLNIDGRTLAPYPFSNQKFQSMCMAQSANQQFLMACDRSGFVHMLNSGNLDGNKTAIPDYFESPFLFEKSPSQSSKSNRLDLFMTANSCGKVYIEDRIDFSSNFKLRKSFNVKSDGTIVQHFESIDIPETFNTYQWRISSSSSTTTPWEMNRSDFFAKGLGIGKNV